MDASVENTTHDRSRLFPVGQAASECEVQVVNGLPNLREEGGKGSDRAMSRSLAYKKVPKSSPSETIDSGLKATVSTGLLQNSKLILYVGLGVMVFTFFRARW